MCIDHSLHRRQRLNSIPLFHNLLKEYVKDAMKKGTYKEVDYSTSWDPISRTGRLTRRVLFVV